MQCRSFKKLQFLSFAPTGSTVPTGSIKHFLWARKLKRNEEREENCITTFENFNLALFTNHKKTFWRVGDRNSVKVWVFRPFTGPKNVLGIFFTMVGKTWWKLKSIELFNLRYLFRRRVVNFFSWFLTKKLTKQIILK